MDWNHDNKKDLITGEGDGHIRVYLNINTDMDPQFDGYFRVQVDGEDFDIGPFSIPFVSDWNNDGLFDLLCGGGFGKVAIMINTGTPGNPIFPTQEYIKDGILNLAVPVGVPTVVDWNRDGKKDLVIGEWLGRIFFFDNKGSDSNPIFDGYTVLKVRSGEDINVGSWARPYPTDWNGDGVIDLLCGNFHGRMHYFEAVGPLALQENAIPESMGGTIVMELHAGSANSRRNYLILGSLSGTEPGMSLPGGLVTLPLNKDGFTDIVLALLNSPILVDFLGKVDSEGEATAVLNMPPVPGFAGVVMYFAYILNKPFNFASNAAAIEIAS